MKNASLLLLLLITGRADPYYTNLSSSPLKNSFRYKQNRLLLTKKKIKKINQRIRRRGYVVDPFHKNFFFSARMIRQYLYQDLNFIKNHACYTADNRRLSPQQAVKPFRNNMALTAIRPIRRGKVIKAVINNPCNLRCMPTDVFRMEKKNDFGCDILQLEFLNLWTKAAVMHYTADKKWVYIRTKNTRGWIKKTNLTVITKAAFNDYFKR
ncbi:MAG TPA: SH3 domain-containing protein, partial [Spirochaetota bacterium]|nr:SH3 domain-containing protein [Spirochaetota bacterium]